MSDIAIRFNGVSKKYEKQAVSIRESFTNFFRKNDPDNDSNSFWALKNVSFDVMRGATVGIIGPNGAGKSTILKLLAGITAPTSGTVSVNGRIGALLELGAGFHPEFTGRENIYLNGSIFGMKRNEVDEKFDAIVDFSGIRDFIDSPVKHYSSGMYVRLGFAIAVHSDPDILLVDEVLAVGDAQFQAKCLKKIWELKYSGVTMALISHNLHSVRIVCDETVVLDMGSVIFRGDTETAINVYTELVNKRTEILASGQDQSAPSIDKTGKDAEILKVELRNSENIEQEVYKTGENLTMVIHYKARTKIANPTFTIGFYSVDGTLYAGHSTALDGLHIESIEGEGNVKVEFEHLSLLPGIYELSIGIFDKAGLYPYDWHQKRYKLKIKGDGNYATGLFYLPHKWLIK